MSRNDSSSTSVSRLNSDFFDKETTNPLSLATNSSFSVVQKQFYDLMRLKNIVITKATQQMNTQNYVLSQRNTRIVGSNSTERSVSITTNGDNTEEEREKGPGERQKEVTEEKINQKNGTVGPGPLISVPYEQYETLMRQLEVERIEHAKTKTKCEELADHLDFARGQVEILQKQLQREKDDFRRVLGSVHESNIVGEERKDQLETQVRELHTDNQQLSRRLRSKDMETEKLQEALTKEKSTQKQRMIDMEVRRCQESYISSMLSAKAAATGRSQISAKKGSRSTCRKTE